MNNFLQIFYILLLLLNRTKQQKVTVADYLFEKKYVIYILVEHYKGSPVARIRIFSLDSFLCNLKRIVLSLAR